MIKPAGVFAALPASGKYEDINDGLNAAEGGAMRMAIIGFATGAAWLQRQASLPDWRWGVACGVALALCFWLLAARRRWVAMSWLERSWGRLPGSRSLSAAFAGFVTGVVWAASIAHLALAAELAREHEGKDFIAIGTIDNLPYRFAQGVRFNFAVERVEDRSGKEVAPTPVPPRIAISWYSGYRDQPATQGAVGDVQPGERWRLTVRLQRPHGNANPYGFDYEAWLLEQGVRATGYVRADRANRRLDRFVFSAGNLVEHGRAALRARILRSLDGKPYAGVIVALVVGDQRGIDQADWQVFNRTGVGHLISISGLHITMVAGLFALLAFTLWRHSFFTRAQLPLLLPAQKVAALVGAVSALSYVLLAGFGVPAQRTLYMLLVVAAALWLNRLADFSHVLCTALGVVVVLDPWAVLWPGFWLSFGAVAVIVYATAGRTTARPARAPVPDEPPAPATRVARAAAWVKAGWPALRLAALTQYAVTLGLLPLTMLLFAQVSLISPIANAVAIPLISLVVTPLALVGSMLPSLLATPVLALAHALVAWLAEGLAWCSGLRYAVWLAPVPPPWLFGLALIGTVWLLAPRGWPVRWLGLATWIPLLAAEPTHPAPGRMTVTAFDVGQGMALLIETSGHRLLYDTGPAYGPEANAGSRVIVPYLRARGIAALDGVVVSHSDADHAGGALAVLDGVRTGWVLSSLAPGHPIAQAALRHVRCAAGQRWTWDGVHFEVLHPVTASYADTSLKPNARGCTLRISTGVTAGASSNALLLAGDIEAAQEAQLLSRNAPRLRADVLLAPHHGSGTSSTRDFLLAVRPQAAVFQVGHRNRYQHPKRDVYERYAELGIARWRTDRDGALTIDFGAAVTIDSYRHTHARYWHDR
jgi:competence protein ComEC